LRTELDRLYGEVLRQQVMTFNEIVDFIQQNNPHLKPKVINDVYITNLIKQNKLLRIRRGLYLGVPLYQTIKEIPQVDKFIVVAKFRKGQGVVTYHGALELYGCAYNAFSEILIGVRSYFHPFNVGTISYRPTNLPKPELGIVRHRLTKEDTVLVTSRERTFIDCLNHVDYAGGWEECLKSLESLGGIRYTDLLELLQAFPNKQLLIRKVGFILEVLQERSIYYEAIPDQVLEGIEKMLSTSILYIDRILRFKENELITRWKLFVPIGFLENHLRGV
jgi:predicted transcriptional regulator of viral defense system